MSGEDEVTCMAKETRIPLHWANTVTNLLSVLQLKVKNKTTYMVS